MSKVVVLPVLRELVRCYQAFERFSAQHTRSMDLTPAQFDIIATLGNTSGMSFKALGEKTLITKGTLTGVIDRLEARRLVERVADEGDGRSTIVRLTPDGDAMFKQVFEPHMEYLRPAFEALPPDVRKSLSENLQTLKEAFESRMPR